MRVLATWEGGGSAVKRSSCVERMKGISLKQRENK